MEEKINNAIAELEEMLNDPEITGDQKIKIRIAIQKAKDKIDLLLKIPGSEKGTKSNQYLHIAIGILVFMIIIKIL